MIAAGVFVDLRRAAELARDYDQRVVEATGLAEVIEQAGDGVVEVWEQVLLQIDEVAEVRVPTGILAEVDLHEPDAGFEQPRRHQERQAEFVPSVAINDRRIGDR